MDTKSHEIDFDQSVIEQLRSLVYRYAMEHLDEFDLQDVHNRIELPEESETGPELLLSSQKVKMSDWMLRRLLSAAKEPGNLTSALEKFVEIFKFRKEYQLSQMRVSNCCPVEFFRIRPVAVGGTDLEGNRLFIIRIRYYQSMAQFDAIIKHYLVYMLEQQDLLFEQGQFGRGLTLMIDCQEFAYRNLSLDMVNFVVQMGFKYPVLIRKVVFFELAWTFSFLFKLVEKLINAQLGTKEKLLYSANKSNVHEHISADELPEFILNGPRKINRDVPPDAISFNDMVKEPLFRNIIESKNAQKIDEYLKSLIKDL